MLIKVIIDNYILIDNLEIDFDSGLNVLTGETGAGKSIILGAIRLGLGARSGGNVIRKGADKAVVQVVFVIDENVAERLSDCVDTTDKMVIFRREIHAGGKSIMRVNDCVVTLNQASKIAHLLLNIHGQSDYQLILDSAGQLDLIDSFLDAAGLQSKSELARLYQSLYAIKTQLDSLSDQPELIEREIDMIKFQMEDIDAVELSSDDEDVEDRYRKIAQSTQLIQSLSEINYTIENEDAADLSRLLNALNRAINSILSDFPHYAETAEKIDDFSYYLAELQRDISADIADLAIDESDRIAVAQRLDDVNAIKKKYGQTIEDIFAYRASLDERLAALQNASVEKASLEAEYRSLKRRYTDCNVLLLERRKCAARAFVDALKGELKALQFKDVSLQVDFKARKQIAAQGAEEAEIMISFNRGVALESLRKVASGGEISRLMLAIKNIIAERDRVPVLIFDEIDSGISGLAAGAVAEKLYRVANYHQVICISHLAQVALMADRHFLIVKDTIEDLAISKVYPLTQSQRVSEIARLISGKEVDDLQFEHASQLLARAQRDQHSIKQGLRGNSYEF